MKELLELTALELGAAIKGGEVSVEEAVRTALEAMEEREGALNSFITRTGEQALDRAKALQAGVQETESPLYGVPMAIKDNICTKGVRTSCASKILGDFAPPYDAGAAERVEQAGAVCLGKLNMDEFAMGSTTETSFCGPTRNPWDLERSQAAPPAGRRRPWPAGSAGSPWARTPAAPSASPPPTAG